MAFSLWSTVFTDNVTKVTAAFLNYLRTNFPNAIDGAEGGTYAPSAPIIVNGDGLQSDNIGDSTLTGTLTLSGSASGVFKRFRADTTTTGASNPSAADDIVRFTGTLTTDITVELPAMAAGRAIHFAFGGGGDGTTDVVIQYEKSDTTTAIIAEIPSNTTGCVTVYSTGGDSENEWAVLMHSPGVNAVAT